MINYISKKVTKALGLIALTGLSGLMNAQTQTWSLAGPVYNAGRIRNVVVDKADPSGKTIYAGSTSSGIFKTTDGGANWAPINDQGSVRNISYMAQSSDNTIYVATGEGFLRPGQILKAQAGTGLYKLVGNNLVSVVSSSVVGEVINRVACSPVNPNVIALATNKGIWTSTDGTNFTSAANASPAIPTVTNSTYGMDVKFNNTGVLYCSIGNERGQVFGVNFSNVPSKVYRSTDASLTAFANITPTSSVLADANYGRIELAIAPSSNNVIYASCARKSNNGPSGASLQGLFVSYDSGDNWALLLQGASQLDPLSNGGTIASGDYAHVLTVNPSNPDMLFMGGYSFYIFVKTNTSNTNPIGTWFQLGSNFAVNTPFYLHENIHDIKIAGSPAKFYFVTDAGIYRSGDLSSATQTITPSFQPFYKGLVTGQFNSVSIEAFPLLDPSSGTTNGTPVVPLYGFIGGTGGNGLNYFSGTSANVSQETNYLSGEVYNAEYSKILTDAALLSTSDGGIYRSTNVKTSDPVLVNYNAYTGPLTKTAPTTSPFSVVGISSGTPFKLWENYGQKPNNINDPVVFYNDTLRETASMIGLQTLTTQTTFTFAPRRPNPSALIDSIVIRTGTVVLGLASSASVTTPFTGPDKKGINIKLANGYTINPTITVPPISSTLGPVSAAGVTLNATTGEDHISVTFTSPAFATKTITSYPIGATGTNIVVPDPAAYYKVFATVFYKYKAGDIVTVVDNNISTKTNSYSAALTQPLNWQYGSTTQEYLITAGGSTAIISPTYVLNPGNVQQSSPVFSVHPLTTTTYSITNTGTYTVLALPVSYTLAASTDTNIPGNPNYTYVLTPGNVTQTATVFTVTPATTTQYTITQTSNSSTMTNETFSTVTTSYSVNPGSTVQSTPEFSVPVGTTPVIYTLTGIATTTSAANTTTTYAFPVITASTVGSSSIPFAQNNPIVKIGTNLSARLAVVLKNPGVTSDANAVVVSKSPLNLNDPLNFVRLSQSGCLTTEADGSPSFTATINIPGKPTILQWSNSGTELYYATDDNSLYRVSYINLIMDFTPTSYSGKLNTDIFLYNSAGAGGVSSTSVNPASPYRTTKIASFPKRITSISISGDDQALVVTTDDATGANTVMYSNTNIKTGSSVPFTSKSGGLVSPTNSVAVKAYCSLIEKDHPNEVYLGTDNGMYFTNNIANGTWVNVNNNQLPNVQIFDIKQQTMGPGASYNSGQIYVATNGRGIWTNSNYFTNSIVSVEEYERSKYENNISIFPNPTNGNVFITFNGVDGESALVHVMDLSGRIIKTENLGKVASGETTYAVETSSLSSGIYLVNVTSTSGVKRVAKLVVAK